MNYRRTQLLVLIALLAAGLAFYAFVQFDKQRSDALEAERTYRSVHHDLADIARANTGGAGGGQRVSVGKLDTAELSRRLTGSATVAGVPDKLVMIEPGTPVRLGTTDYSEMQVFLRFDTVTLQQLTVFLHQLAATDPGSRAKSIELSVPENLPGTAAATGGELWTADVAVAYLMFAPKEGKAR